MFSRRCKTLLCQCARKKIQEKKKVSLRDISLEMLATTFWLLGHLGVNKKGRNVIVFLKCSMRAWGLMNMGIGIHSCGGHIWA